MVHGIVENHGARLTVKTSSIDAPEIFNPAQKRAGQIGPQGPEGGVMTDPLQQTILIVDDVEFNLDILGHVLADGYHVVRAMDGATDLNVRKRISRGLRRILRENK